MCIVPRDFERNAARSAPRFDLATAMAFGPMPGDEPQGRTSPPPSLDVLAIEAQLAELTSLVAADL